MSILHGVNANRADTSFNVTAKTASGIPIYFGCAPVHTAGGYTGHPQVANNFAEAKALFGYSDDWRDGVSPKWSLCEAMYSHFQLFGASPAIFYNLFDPATHISTAGAGTSKTVTDHKIKLSIDTVVVSSVKKESTTLVKGTDYDVVYDGESCVIELIPTSTYYDEAALTVATRDAVFTAIDAAAVETALEKIDECKTLCGIVPDLICTPGFTDAELAAVAAAKGEAINGIYKAKAVVDIAATASGVTTVSSLLTFKQTNGYTDDNMIVCWPMYKIGSRVYDMSVIVCGLLASVDADNGGVPSRSPSNNGIPDGATVCLTGSPVAPVELILTLQQGDTVSVTAGVVTALNFGGWRLWGNYTGCFPGESDVAKKFICTSRMQDFLCNRFIEDFYTRVDRPLNRALIDSIVNEYNAWLAGLVHDGHLYGGEIAYIEDNNSTSDLLSGHFRLDVTTASPVPAEQINMLAQYDVNILTAAFAGE